MTPSWRRRASCRVRVAGERSASSGKRSARRRPAMLKPGRCRAASRVCFNAAEKVQPADVTAVNGTGLGQAVEGADAGREVIQTGEVLKVAAVTTAQDVTQIIEAVDGLFDGSEGAGRRALAMFYHAVVLESGDVVGGRLDAQDQSEFVVDLD